MVGHTLKLYIISLLQLQLTLLIGHLVLVVAARVGGTLAARRVVAAVLCTLRHHADLAHVVLI